MIYITGHKPPDLDSVAGAISFANFKNKSEKTNQYKAIIPSKVNQETAYVLKKFNFKIPVLLKNAKGKNLILVDHNEFSQAIDGIEKANIIEILDHHKVNFKYEKPIVFEVKPWGSVCSIIAEKYFQNRIKISKEMAGLILSAILVDTVITKSPTCTPKDIEIIKKLSSLAKIADWKKFGMEIFKVRSSVVNLSSKEIIKSDFKDFDFKAGKFGIGQVETVDLGEIKPLEGKLLLELEKIKKARNYHTMILFITDIIKGGSEFLVASNEQKKIEKALGAELKQGRVYLKGIISRKKQVTPGLSKIFDR
ncbi:MAG: manganese-dependent inorganic pyrophosphatase [Xanthomonadaceae bacterium]|nr:manganese-dependent inorganic pyrophosphatase [Rhodospirillaceae bacterium]NIA17862.1 manganese-dependent inorganic pyrophosphatase [Xanthomonadaceae bacterium]